MKNLTFDLLSSVQIHCVDILFKLSIVGFIEGNQIQDMNLFCWVLIYTELSVSSGVWVFILQYFVWDCLIRFCFIKSRIILLCSSTYCTMKKKIHNLFIGFAVVPRDATRRLCRTIIFKEIWNRIGSQLPTKRMFSLKFRHKHFPIGPE